MLQLPTAAIPAIDELPAATPRINRDTEGRIRSIITREHVSLPDTIHPGNPDHGLIGGVGPGGRALERTPAVEIARLSANTRSENARGGCEQHRHAQKRRAILAEIHNVNCNLTTLYSLNLLRLSETVTLDPCLP